MLRDWPGKIDPFGGSVMRLMRQPGFAPGFLLGGGCAALILVPIFTIHPSEWVSNQVVDAAARPFVDRLRAEDTAGAYSLGAPEFQQSTSPEAMRRSWALISRNAGKIDVVQFEGLRPITQPASPTVDAYYKLTGQQGDVRARVLMSRRAGAWQVVSFTMEPLMKRAVVRRGVPAS